MGRRAQLKARIISVRPLGLSQRASVGFFSENGLEIGYLNPAYKLPGLVSQGEVPEGRVHIFARGLKEESHLQGELEVELSQTKDCEFSVQMLPRKVIERSVRVVSRNNERLGQVSAEVVLDGSHERARNALLNYQQLVSQEDGQMAFSFQSKESMSVVFKLPFLGAQEPVAISSEQTKVTLPIDVVRCAFRCANGKRAGYAGFVAILKLKDGTEQRFERPYSDALRSADVLFAWSKDARELSVHSTGFHSVKLRSPKQACILRPLGRREACELRSN